MKVKANGIETNYTLDGQANAPVVTLSHSLATDNSMWDPQMDALRARYRVLRYETRGHGSTEAPAAAYTLDQLADDARALLQALGISRTHWVGLSMGGMIGQTLALKHPELFASLSLCDTSSRIPAEAKPLWADRIKTAETKGMDPLVEPTLARWLTAPFRERRKDVVDKVATMIRSTPPLGYAGCCHAISALDLTDRISAISIPTFVIVGEEDQGTPVAASKVMNERIKGSELVILPSAAHLSNLEQPEAFTGALTTFLAKHSGS
jgi:3-oxoadipate enol-lactonase